MYTICLLEDEKHLNQLLAAYLKEAGWTVFTFLNVEEATKGLEIAADLWILDVMLSDGSGYDFIKEIKERNPHIPIIFISARDQSFDRIMGLEIGGDDYLAKPFLAKELVVRSRKILDRTYGNMNYSSVTQIKVGKYTIVEEHRSVQKEGEAIDLTSREFDLIFMFAKHKNRVFTREDLIDHVWGNDYFGSDRVVDDLIRRVRKKLDEFPIETIYGYGYRLCY